MKNFLLFLCIFVFVDNHLFPEGNLVEETLKKYPVDNATFLLPINVADAKLNLELTIPDNFKLVDNPPETKIIEFIPREDQDPNNWSEIITVGPFIGEKIKAKEFVDSIISRFQKLATDIAIIKKEEKIYSHYEEAMCLLSYRYRSREELLMVYAASGPFDLAMVQYSIHLKNGKDKEPAIQKIEQFFSTHVKISEAAKKF